MPNEPLDRPFEELSDEDIISPDAREAFESFTKILLANGELFQDSLDKLNSRGRNFEALVQRTIDLAAAQKKTDGLAPLILSLEATLQIEPPPFIVDRILPAHSIVIMYGREGIGKSFVALDLALSVATGQPFLGQFPTEQGLVVYLTAEGTGNLGARTSTWLQARTGGKLPRYCPIFFIPQPIQLNTLDGFTSLNLALDRLYRMRPKLFIIDTYHSCMATADENDASDVGRFLMAANFLRHEAGSSVLIIHHSSKADENNPRGHGALQGAADTVIQVKRVTGPDVKIGKITCRKQKDAEPFPDFTFKMTPTGRSVLPEFVAFTEPDDSPEAQSKAVTDQLSALKVNSENPISSSKTHFHPPESNRLLSLTESARNWQPLTANFNYAELCRLLTESGFSESWFSRHRKTILSSGPIRFNDKTGLYSIE